MGRARIAPKTAMPIATENGLDIQVGRRAPLGRAHFVTRSPSALLRFEMSHDDRVDARPTRVRRTLRSITNRFEDRQLPDREERSTPA
jgi:hypothetical protein